MPIPGLHRIEGVIELREIAERARLVGASFTLELEDGRSLKPHARRRRGPRACRRPRAEARLLLLLRDGRAEPRAAPTRAAEPRE